MNNDNMNIYDIDVLEDLKRQVKELKDQLTASNIVTQSIMRKAMKGSSSWLDRFVKTEIVTLPLLVLIIGSISYHLGTSIWPTIVFLIIGTISAWFDWYTMRIATKNILTMPMAQLKANLIKQKKYRRLQTLIETPLSIVWLVWYIISVIPELIRDNEIGKELYLVLGISVALGILIALVVIYIIYNKAQNTNNELIETIDSGENLS